MQYMKLLQRRNRLNKEKAGKTQLNNPCSGKWNLCNSPIYYLHSSAKYYLSSEDGLYTVTDVEDD